MAGSINFRLSPSVLEWARTSMGYSIEEAAKKAGVSFDKYESWEKGNRLPTYKQLEDLAEKVYKRPLAVLLSKAPPNEKSILSDFRSLSNTELTDLSAELRFALRQAKRYQFVLEEVNINDDPGKISTFKVSKKEDPYSAAKRFRHFIGLTLEEQKSWRHEDAFRNFRQVVESIGIYIFQIKMPIQQARAFCLTGSFPIIVLNKDDSTNGRIFSIFHELCHLLFNQNNIFKDTLSGNLLQEYAEIEDFCNHFSASFLVPDDSFDQEIQLFRSKVTDSDIQRLANTYNVSNEVIARKLLSRRLIGEDFFWKKKNLWDSMARNAKEKENQKMKEQDPHGINQGIKIISDKGRNYVASVVNAYQQGNISSSDLSNYLETKIDHLPKIIDRLKF